MKLFCINILNLIIYVNSYILHISDIHLDNKYYLSSFDKCLLGDTGLGCCRKYDLPLEHSLPVSKYGDYNCDSPISLVDGTLDWINSNMDIDYIIYTGDTVDHHDITQSPSHNQAEINIVFKLFNKYFPDTKIFYAIGNHDTYPIDQSSPYIYNNFLTHTNSLMSKWLSEKSQHSMKLGGYYSELISDTLKVISLNTIYYDKNNLFKSDNDPKHQMEWLKSELEDATNNNQYVWILGHIPPNKATDYFKEQMLVFHKTYSDIIQMNFFGHTHKDHFELYSNKDNITGCILIPPSLVPYHQNPSFRLLNVNINTGLVMDYKQYTANLNNIIENNIVSFNESYTFTKLYDLDDVSCDSLTELYNKLQNNDNDFLNYYNNFIPKNGYFECDSTCKDGVINLIKL
jgi:sphingomyelin phosphodiesterase